MPSTPRIFVGAATFRIGAPGSSECVRAVTREVASVPGVVGATVDLVTCLLTVTAAAPLDRSEIVAAVERAGHRVVG